MLALSAARQQEGAPLNAAVDRKTFDNQSSGVANNVSLALTQRRVDLAANCSDQDDTLKTNRYWLTASLPF